jgi:hypothetical protein
MTNIDAAYLEALAENYRYEAATCDQMARADRRRKTVWLRLAEEWRRLAAEADARSRRPN